MLPPMQVQSPRARRLDIENWNHTPCTVIFESQKHPIDSNATLQQVQNLSVTLPSSTLLLAQLNCLGSQIFEHLSHGSFMSLTDPIRMRSLVLASFSVSVLS